MKGPHSSATRTTSDQHADVIMPANDDTPVAVQPAHPLPLQSPRLLTRQQASDYCGVTSETFDDYRRRGIVPDPIEGTNRWDRKLIDQWLDRASGIASETETSLDGWRAKRNG